MKLHKLLLTAGSAAVTYWFLTKKTDLAAESHQTINTVKDIKEKVATIQEQVATIKTYQEPIQDMSQDLTYKLRVYKQSIAGNLDQIKTIKEKYLPNEKNDAS